MDIEELLAAARDNLTVRRVFAEPYVQDGVTVIAAAKVMGGGGGGHGHDQQGGDGEGGGLGLVARPVGAYVIKDGQVRWVPAVDVTRLMTLAGAITLVSLLVRRRPRARKGDG